MDAQVWPKEFMQIHGRKLLPDGRTALSSFFSDCLKHLSVDVGWTSGKALNCRCQSRHQMKLKNSDYTNVFPNFTSELINMCIFRSILFYTCNVRCTWIRGVFLHLSPQHYLTSSSLYDLPLPIGLMLKIHFRGWEKRKKPNTFCDLESDNKPLKHNGGNKNKVNAGNCSVECCCHLTFEKLWLLIVSVVK